MHAGEEELQYKTSNIDYGEKEIGQSYKSFFTQIKTASCTDKNPKLEIHFHLPELSIRFQSLAIKMFKNNNKNTNSDQSNLKL